jgi:hypothetical protein
MNSSQVSKESCPYDSHSPVMLQLRQKFGEVTHEEPRDSQPAALADTAVEDQLANRIERMRRARIERMQHAAIKKMQHAMMRHVRIKMMQHAVIVRMRHARNERIYRENAGAVMAQLRTDLPLRVNVLAMEGSREVRNLNAAEQAAYNAIVVQLQQELTHAFVLLRNAWNMRQLNALERSNCDTELLRLDRRSTHRVIMIELAWRVRINRSLEQETFDYVLEQLKQEIPWIVELKRRNWDVCISMSVTHGNSGVVMQQLRQTLPGITETRNLRTTRETFIMGGCGKRLSDSLIRFLDPDVMMKILTMDIMHQ